MNVIFIYLHSESNGIIIVINNIGLGKGQCWLTLGLMYPFLAMHDGLEDI